MNPANGANITPRHLDEAQCPAFHDPYDGLGPDDISQAELRSEASMCFGDCDDGELHPDDAHWTYNPNLPVKTLFPLFSRDEWLDWFAKENLGAVEEGRAGWTYLVEETICEPIVLTIIGGKVSLWGGWHRAGATFAKGGETIRAIVGVPKSRPLGTFL